MTSYGGSVAQRTKPRVTVTLDPGLLLAVDQYVQEHRDEGVDRSGVVSQALQLWYREQLHEAMRAQFLAPPSKEESSDRAAWDRIRQAAGEDFVRRYEQREGP